MKRRTILDPAREGTIPVSVAKAVVKRIKKKRWSKEAEELRQLIDEAFLSGLNDLGTAKFLIKKGYSRGKK